MRFDSITRLLSFLEGLQIAGFVIPFIDYKSDMVAKGFNKHIHNYVWEITNDNVGNMYLCTSNDEDVYVIEIMKGLV